MYAGLKPDMGAKEYWQGTLAVRKEGFVPQSRRDGTVVYEGRGSEFLDKDLEQEKRYVYAVYTFNKKGEFSKPVLGDVILREDDIEAKVVEPEKTQMEPKPVMLNIFQRFWRWILSVFGRIQ